jgi:short-subunit dehydrogenase
MDIDGKVAIVTGASSGIGLEICRLLSRLGARVVLVSRSRGELLKISRELKNSLPIPVDMTDHKAIKKMVNEVIEHYGRIDVLINNAGRGYDASIESIDIDIFRQIIDLDLLSPVYAMQQVAPIMKAQGGGSIINISSGTALMHLPGMSAYAATKAALAHLSLTAREEFKQYKINVSVVYPYITDTNFEKNTIKSLDTYTSEGSANPGYEPPKADTAEFVAKKIVNCIMTGEPEVYAHDWMKAIGKQL